MTHNYDPDGPFLGNICDLPLSEAEAVLERIRRASGRAIKPNYLERRHCTEEWLIERRRALLGETRRERPIYFFLGNFADGRDPSRPCSLVMPLSALPSDSITFTYPDSMTSFAARSESGTGFPYGEVFTFEQILSVIEECGLPARRAAQRTAQRPTAHHERYIEMQVWDDRPVLALAR